MEIRHSPAVLVVASLALLGAVLLGAVLVGVTGMATHATAASASATRTTVHSGATSAKLAGTILTAHRRGGGPGRGPN